MDKPRHLKSKHFLASGLFADLRSFDEFERRVSALPSEKDRGDAFEVFAEAYLATQRKYDAAQVWPLCAAALELLRKLGLATNDYGVDGILQTTLGQLNVYQVKFRTNRRPLTWRELSTFMGLADSQHIHSRVLLTNCDELPSVMNERRGFFCIRGADLDRLEESDFIEIEKWLTGVAASGAKKSPQPHQQEALDALLPALREHDRATAIMACGTGKTLLSLWIAEQMAVSKCLVLLPSLALVRQTLHEWLHETRLSSLAYLCVCSDRTVASDLDTIATPQSELDFEVTTDSRSVCEFLDTPFAGVKVIFSTYQSARVVAAGMECGDLSPLSPADDLSSANPARELAPRKSGDKSPHTQARVFDLGIFDEAHKTAGREGRNFAFALEDKNLAIRKRLFLTATPRHYNPLRKDKEGDAQLVFSMDKPDVYGPQVYRLTFAEAARRDIICHYRVIISVITSGMVTNELLNRGEVLVNGDAIRARQVANQLALKDAIAKYGVNKIFTFHSSVKSAASFTSDGPEGIATHLSPVAADMRRLISKSAIGNPKSEMDQSLVTSSATNEFKTFHVNGTMPTALRERVMRGFRECARGIMSNARCLTEGVDVPAVDMVAFLSPRRSRVDIVQATGRAMRRAPNKTTGYVLVPLYLEQAAGETIEQAVGRAEFDDVWDVLQSLQEQDEVLAEIIREMREERGRTKGFDDARFRERVEICGPSVSIDALRKAITTMGIQFLADSWEERFGELKAFRSRFTHCNVPIGWRENRSLATWVFNQRRRRNILSQDRIRRLEAIGFVWKPHPAFWETMFAALVEYKRMHGHCNIPLRDSNDPRLADWVNRQRSARNRGLLSEDQIRRLDEQGFVWSIRDSRWEEMFVKLAQYKRTHGHCELPIHGSDQPELGRWINRQRSARNCGSLTEDQIRRLNEQGFVWDVHGARWEHMFAQLAEYKRTSGDCNVPQGWIENPQLGTWVGEQRANRKRLDQEKARRLEQLGFSWAPYDSYWEAMFASLLRYKDEHGDCNVPKDCADYEKLGPWILRQRAAKKNGRLTSEKVRRLEEIGFDWSPQDNAWEKMFGALLQFKQRWGHCNVPQQCNEFPGLGQWISRQRQDAKFNRIESERLEKLKHVDFIWNARDAHWETMFAALEKYRREQGNCDVPDKWEKNQQLASWVGNLRQSKKANTLDLDRIRRLEAIGFQWVIKRQRRSGKKPKPLQRTM